MVQVEEKMSDTHLEQLAELALTLYKSTEELKHKLEKVKNDLRAVADGEHKKVAVPGVGVVTISSPRLGGEVTGRKIEVDSALLDNHQDIKKILIEKSIIKEVDIISIAAAASVTIKPNV
jgi:hypothetical protein